MIWALKKAFSAAGNFYWKIFGGIFLATLWAAIGLALMFSVLGFPIALDCFKIAYVNYKPFGKRIVLIPNRIFASIIWLVSVGWIIGSISIFNALLSCATIIGLPLLKQWLKVCKLAFFPFCSVWV
ncbi:MAG: hypothetical protein K2M75_02675 [Clostridia bacterium]|nr:hypothetical protein [Clostridia bacterium]